MTKASDLFLQCLVEQGVDTIYGVPGEENADLMISLLDSPIEFITCRHEQSAAFMADMHGRLTGKPGVCMGTLGPGATNLLTAVAQANMDHVPLIAIIGQAETGRLHKESHQNMDAISLYKPVSKWATTIREADVIPEVIKKAFKLSMQAKPGACVIELPEDIAKKDTGMKPIACYGYDIQAGVGNTELDAALELLANSERPVFLIGNGCVQDPCQETLHDILSFTGAYAATTFMGKGAISTRHDHSLYCVGLGQKDIALHAYDIADLVVCIGYDMVEWHPDRWNPDHKHDVIHIDTVPAEVDQNYIPKIELVGGIAGIVKSLQQKLTSAHQKQLPAFAKVRQQVSDDLNRFNDDDAFPMKPQRALADVRRVLADDDIVISDVGAHKMWIARQYDTYLPKSCFISNGFCSMAGAMPNAVGAKRLYPERHVVAICGDGGFIMSIQALVTAVQFNVPITVLVWQDNYYGLIKWKQEAAYQQFSHVALDNPDLCAVAKAFGANAMQLQGHEELVPALLQAAASKDKPTVIVLPIDYSQNMKLTEHLGEIVCR